MDTQLKPLFKVLDDNYSKVPALSSNLRENLVKIAPWLSLIGGILLVWAAYGLYVLATSPVVGYIAAMGGFSYAWIISAVVLLVGGVLELLAFSPLKARKEKGWNLLFYASLLYVLSSVVRLSLGGIIFSVIGFLIAYYFLYQVKSYYK